jgi:BlaI family transcriptional regulator, penicillinase repressor
MLQQSHYDATSVTYTEWIESMPKQKPEQLTRREREIMNAIFALGNRASAEDVRSRMPNPPSYSSVRVMLTRLEKKGYVKHQEDGPRYMYSATTSPAIAKRSALQQYLKTFFGGSLRQMMTALVSEASWTDADLDALRAEIDRVRKDRRRQP